MGDRCQHNWFGADPLLADADDRKFAEQVFNGSLAVLAVLIAVAGIVAAGYDKISGNPDVEPHFRYYLWATAALACFACGLGLLALERAQGRAIPLYIVVWSARLLLLGVAAAIIGLVLVTLL